MDCSIRKENSSADGLPFWNPFELGFILNFIITLVYLINVLPKIRTKTCNPLQDITLVKRATTGIEVIAFPYHRETRLAKLLCNQFFLSLKPCQKFSQMIVGIL